MIIVGPILWRNLKFYELNEVRRQENQQFTSILTKIGKSEQLDEIEITLIESRFCTVEEAELRCPQDIRLFNTNNSVNEYNNKILNTYADRITSTTKDACIGCASKEQETFVLQKLYKMSLIDTNGLPYQTVYVNNIYYMITPNIDVTDGLTNGAVGKLVHVKTYDEGLVKTIWPEFPVLPQIGEKLRRKKNNFALSLQNNRIILTTKSNTTIYAVFSRFLNDIECKTYISYFSFHKPLITKECIEIPISIIGQVIYSQVGLAIHQNDHQARRRFVEWAQNEIAIVPDFHKRILFSDEAHFWLNGYVNKQNCRIWSDANPQVYVETLLHPEKLTVWCALWAGGILLQKR
ncbi:ATP-dependent DNA helicase [Trichonephila clavipes]|nr:ATP-dependent DNA helicase [Trichonephila clavipes]